jgi:hypothetical protein
VRVYGTVGPGGRQRTRAAGSGAGGAGLLGTPGGQNISIGRVVAPRDAYMRALGLYYEFLISAFDLRDVRPSQANVCEGYSIPACLLGML